MVIFGAGVVTGGLLVGLARGPAQPDHPSAHARTPPATSVGSMRLEFLRRAQRDLELTADQREHINRILRESQERIRAITEPINPQIREELKRTRADFVQVLTPEQRKRFNEMAREQQQQQQRARELRNAQSPTQETPAEPGSH